MPFFLEKLANLRKTHVGVLLFEAFQILFFEFQISSTHTFLWMIVPCRLGSIAKMTSAKKIELRKYFIRL